MSSFNQKQYKRRRSVAQMVGIAVVVIGAIVLTTFMLRRVKNATIKHKPLIGASTIYNTFLPKKTLVAKIVDLETTLVSREVMELNAVMLQEENTMLKAELNRSPRPEGTLAHIVTLPNRSFYDTVVIDAGTIDGIQNGQTIYAFGSIALGTITDVAEDHATAQLFSASGRTTSGTANESDVIITLIGRGAGEYEVRLPRDLKFTIGQLIAYQSTDSSVLAQIERIVTDPRDPFQRLIAKAPINLQALKWVIVR